MNDAPNKLPFNRPSFKLVVVSTQDGFIARYSGHPPHDWASTEEQTVFFREVDAADWGIMGRGTHEAVDRPERRRIIFSTQVDGAVWRRPTQLWINPEQATLRDFTAHAAERHKFEKGLILGGTGVHDWFLAQNAIDEILLTIEPIRFGEGLPIFSTQDPAGPEKALAKLGFTLKEEQTLNAGGTRLLRFVLGD
ncbi:MAG: dihydrofolate reductase family protein [Sulfitobacter sp.]